MAPLKPILSVSSSSHSAVRLMSPTLMELALTLGMLMKSMSWLMR
jgi:hypothetical protein